MRRVVIFAVAFLAAISIGAAGLTACAGGEMEKPGELGPVEITEYEGEKLSSVNDFRENSIAGPQYVDLESYQLQVGGLVGEPKNYTYDQVITESENYRKVVTLDCVEGWSVNILWQGVLVKDLIAKSGALPDAKVVIFHAYDGYTTSFPVEFIMDNEILLAYRMNEVDLPQERGFPFQLVAESKWGYKWIKWVTAIELSDDENYRGFWESKGYSDDGSLDEPFFE